MLTAWANRARARREGRAREAERRRSEKLFNEQMSELAWLTRALDFDSGLGALTLELLGTSDVPVIEADVIRGYDEYADAVILLRKRMASSALFEEGGTASIQKELSRWHGVGKVISRHLPVCDGPIRQTIQAQLEADQAWLGQTRQHHQ